VINLVVNGTRLLAVHPGLPAIHFLGEPVETRFGDGDTALLGCLCGDPGCWPLTARVTVSATTVTWRDFRTGHRDWDLSAVGPFTIDRHAYEPPLPRRTTPSSTRVAPTERAHAAGRALARARLGTPPCRPLGPLPIAASRCAPVWRTYS
jgi:hypothetical protein